MIFYLPVYLLQQNKLYSELVKVIFILRHRLLNRTRNCNTPDCFDFLVNLLIFHRKKITVPHFLYFNYIGSRQIMTEAPFNFPHMHVKWLNSSYTCTKQRGLLFQNFFTQMMIWLIKSVNVILALVRSPEPRKNFARRVTRRKYYNFDNTDRIVLICQQRFCGYASNLLRHAWNCDRCGLSDTGCNPQNFNLAFPVRVPLVEFSCA